jgi:type IV pilus assembly protein PilN
MRISLNLATRPFADLGPTLKRLQITMAALGLAAIALGIGVYGLDQTAKAARAREHTLDLKTARLNSERQGYQAMMREPTNAAVLAEAENLNQLFDEKAFSWTLAMEDLETLLPSGVQVTTLEPVRDKDGHITLHLRVLGARDRSLALVENLEHSKRFFKPRIIGESAETSGGPNQRIQPVNTSDRVNFDLLADYNPPPPGERRPPPTAPSGQAGRAPRLRTLPPRQPGTLRPPYTGVSGPSAPVPPKTGGPR